MKKNPTFKVRLKSGGSITVAGESFQPFEPSAYCWDAFWECTKDDTMFFVYLSSGDVSLWDEVTEKEIEKVGYVPAILKQIKKEIAVENEMIEREKRRDL